MIFYILGNQITTLFLSLGLLTTLSFKSPIESYIYGGKVHDAIFKVTNSKRTLAIKLKNKAARSNLLVITKYRKYYFDIQYSKSNPHQFVEVVDGEVGEFYSDQFENNDIKILNGEKSILIINKKKKPTKINNISVATKGYFSKGIPLIVRGKRIFN